jgi:hypothetical protein
VGTAAWFGQLRRRDAWIARQRGFGHGAGRNGRLYGAVTTATLPRVANPGTTRGGLAADRRAPHVCAFSFLEILKNSFPHKKSRYKVKKNLRNFLKVGNQVWNTFHH